MVRTAVLLRWSHFETAAMARTVNEILAFALFRKHMKEVVIPAQLAGVFEADEEIAMLILAQWSEMPLIEKQRWKIEAQTRQNLISSSTAAAGACSGSLAEIGPIHILLGSNTHKISFSFFSTVDCSQSCAGRKSICALCCFKFSQKCCGDC